jgi:UDP-N-acetyl-D-glucosamine dehydrogenase
VDEKAAVIGLGYVGLPLALAFASRGFQVIGIDTSDARLKTIRQGKVQLIPEERKVLKRALAEGRLTLSPDYEAARGTTAFILCLPTPLNAHAQQDLGAIQQALSQLRGILSPGALIVLESTVTPGTTTKIIAPLLSGWGWTPGEGIFLGYSPERIDPGNKAFPVARIPKIVSGVTRECLKRTLRLYERIVERVVPVSDPTVAELAKVYENLFRAVNIGLANELAVICNALGVPAAEVVEAAATKPFGFMKFTAGAGIGGHCIPLAPHYLAEACERTGLSPEFPGLALRANARMVPHIVGEIGERLRANGKMMVGARVLVVGVTYKARVADTRNSPGVRLLKALNAAGAKAGFYDPLVSQIAIDGARIRGIPRAQWRRGRWDAVVLATGHPRVTAKDLRARAPIVIGPGVSPGGARKGRGSVRTEKKFQTADKRRKQEI